MLSVPGLKRIALPHTVTGEAQVRDSSLRHVIFA
jgi:hypothetical protein